MFEPKDLEELTQRLFKALPAGVREMQRDVEKNVRAVLQTGFAKMDLVSREEFDIQAAVLARTREKLELLERQVTELEARLKPK